MGKITVDPKVRFGKPCIKGTRITVQEVLELINQGISFQEIIEEYYPDLTEEDIKACIEYAIKIISEEEVHLEAI
ncbi:DUF433 domain-containing protein [Thermodesulfatator atlanticus]|uniref:DUF433 domain-containing protein n=1 Tax=Thermodesulfatator atlanticus TaxID=501497 RepID=UPI0003B6AEDA|nr:DUF433 domain-containing protein [Thermodesulfatator atlanticus]